MHAQVFVLEHQATGLLQRRGHIEWLLGVEPRCLEAGLHGRLIADEGNGDTGIFPERNDRATSGQKQG